MGQNKLTGIMTAFIFIGKPFWTSILTGKSTFAVVISFTVSLVMATKITSTRATILTSTNSCTFS